MTDREVMQMALLALEGWDNYGKWAWPDTALEQSKRNTTESLASLRAALEQPEHDPVAWMFEFPDKRVAPKFDSAPHGGNWVPLYTSPPQRQWSSLTDDEIKEIVGPWGDMPIKGYTRELFDKIDEALKRKNT